MIERLTDLPAGIDGFRARGAITGADYEKIMRPVLDEARGQGRRIRFLYHFGPDFEGFTASGAWEDMRLGLSYLRLFERCAIVSDVGWIRESSRLFGTMMPCPVKVFGNGEREQALAWLAAPAESEVAHRLIPEAGVLIVEPRGRLRREDFDALASIVDPWIEAHGELRGLVVHAREFPGWENLGAAIRHLRFVRDHHRRVRRVAFCAGGALAAVLPRLAEHFVTAEVRHFDPADLDRAVAWAGGAAAEE